MFVNALNAYTLECVLIMQFLGVLLNIYLLFACLDILKFILVQSFLALGLQHCTSKH